MKPCGRLNRRMFCAGLSLLFAGRGLGVTFDDGMLHILDSSAGLSGDSIIILDSAAGDPTQVRMTGGGVGGGMSVFGSSGFELMGGTVSSFSQAFDMTSVFTGAGTMHSLTLWDQATLEAQASTIRELVLNDQASMTMSSGTLGADGARAQGDSTMSLSLVNVVTLTLSDAANLAMIGGSVSTLAMAGDSQADLNAVQMNNRTLTAQDRARVTLRGNGQLSTLIGRHDTVTALQAGTLTNVNLSDRAMFVMEGGTASTITTSGRARVELLGGSATNLRLHADSSARVEEIALASLQTRQTTMTQVVGGTVQQLDAYDVSVVDIEDAVLNGILVTNFANLTGRNLQVQTALNIRENARVDIEGITTTRVPSIQNNAIARFTDGTMAQVSASDQSKVTLERIVSSGNVGASGDGHLTLLDVQATTLSTSTRGVIEGHGVTLLSGVNTSGESLVDLTDASIPGTTRLRNASAVILRNSTAVGEVLVEDSSNLSLIGSDLRDRAFLLPDASLHMEAAEVFLDNEPFDAQSTPPRTGTLTLIYADRSTASFKFDMSTTTPATFNVNLVPEALPAPPLVFDAGGAADLEMVGNVAPAGIEVRDASGGAPTMLEPGTGAVIGTFLDLRGQSGAVLDQAQIGASVIARQQSSFAATGGRIDRALLLFDAAAAELSDVAIGETLAIRDGSSLMMTGGEIRERLVSFGASSLNVAQTTVTGPIVVQGAQATLTEVAAQNLTIRGEAQATVTDVDVEVELAVRGNSATDIIGGEIERLDARESASVMISGARVLGSLSFGGQSVAEVDHVRMGSGLVWGEAVATVSNTEVDQIFNVSGGHATLRDVFIARAGGAGVRVSSGHLDAERLTVSRSAIVENASSANFRESLIKEDLTVTHSASVHLVDTRIERNVDTRRLTNFHMEGGWGNRVTVRGTALFEGATLFASSVWDTGTAEYVETHIEAGFAARDSGTAHITASHYLHNGDPLAPGALTQTSGVLTTFLGDGRVSTYRYSFEAPASITLHESGAAPQLGLQLFDGGVHAFSAANPQAMTVLAGSSPKGVGTQVQVNTGALLERGLRLEGGATGTLTGGEIVTHLMLSDQAHASLSGVTLTGHVMMLDQSTAQISGGTLGFFRPVFAFDQAKLTITDGLIEGLIDFSESAVLEIQGGSVTRDGAVSLRDQTRAVMRQGMAGGGTVRGMTLLNNATLDAQAGSINTLEARDDSRFTLRGEAAVNNITSPDRATGGMSGEASIGQLSATGSGFFLMTGGQVTTRLTAGGNSTIDLRGGQVGGSLQATQLGVFNIYGTDFQRDGKPIPYGLVPPPLTGTLSGTLADGTPFSAPFTRVVGTRINLIRMVLGDFDGDFTLDAFDIAGLELALADPAAYAAANPGLNPDILGDFDASGELDAFDVAAFEQRLANSGAAVPEPAVGTLMLLGGIAMGRRRR